MKRQDADVTREALHQHLAQEQSKNKDRVRLNDPNRLDVALNTQAEQRKREAEAQPIAVSQPEAPAVTGEALPTMAVGAKNPSRPIAQIAEPQQAPSLGNITINPKSLKKLKVVKEPSASTPAKQDSKSRLAGDNYKEEMQRVLQANVQKGRAQTRLLQAEAAKRPQLPEDWADQLQKKVSQDPFERDMNAVLEAVGMGEPKKESKKKFFGFF